MLVSYTAKLLGACALLGAAVLHAWPYIDVALGQAKIKVRGKKTVDERLEQYGAAADARLAPHFDKAGVAYPPAEIVLVAYKHEKVLDLYAAGEGGKLAWIRRYPIKAASGKTGPKLREGDYQVPEGLYRIELLNPNSSYHLSLRVNYPNAFDRKKGAADGRENLGSDIMIHGKALSAGCLAMGDPAAEELFVLAARSGHENIEVVIAPWDMAQLKLRDAHRAELAKITPWYPELVEIIQARLKQLPPRPAATGAP